jgi:DNA topoisomerase-3
MTAIITDSANIAKQFALVLNMDVKTEDAGYFQGHGFTLVWAGEELLSLLPPENRPGKSDLPFIPETFTLSVRKKKTKTRMVTDKSAAKQLNVIRKVFDECESIVVATDAEEKGELTFRRIYSYLDCKKPFQRLWLNSLAAGAIREGFNNLKEGALYDNLYAAADCRAKADFLISVNASHAFGLATGLVNRPLGRLEIPGLAMICKRFLEYRKFIPIRFYEHRITLEKDRMFQSFALPVSLKNRRKAEKIYERLKTFHTAQITKVETQSRIQPAPTLYGLTSLQADACVRYGFSPAKTMEIARKLCEEKLISHPLTDSRHIPEDVFETIPKIIRHTAAYCGLGNCLKVMDWNNLNSRSVDSTDVSGHHALIPTGIYPGYLPKDDRTVYEMIVCRTLEAFAPDCQKEFIRIEAAIGDLVLVSEKSKIITPGWRAIQSRAEDREQDEAGESDAFPQFTEGETVRISGWNLLTRKTLPKPLYTGASLLLAMEDAALGTAETRTRIIESLFSCGYVERRGQSLIPTEKGLVVYNCVKNTRIADMQQAGGWERMLIDVREGRQEAGTFMTAFKIFTGQVTEEILAIQKPSPGKRRERSV